MKVVIDAYKEWDLCGDEYLKGYDVSLVIKEYGDKICLKERYSDIVYTFNKDDFIKLLKFLSLE